MLLFFTFTTVFGLSKFHNQQYQCVKPQYTYLSGYSSPLDRFPLTGGSGWLSLARLLDVYLGTFLTLTFYNSILQRNGVVSS